MSNICKSEDEMGDTRSRHVGGEKFIDFFFCWRNFEERISYTKHHNVDKADDINVNPKEPVAVAARLLGLRVRIPPGAWLSLL
jgi:hypothetical protein